MGKSTMRFWPAVFLCCCMGAIAASPAERLSMALQFKTVSYQDREQIDYAEFQSFLLFLEESYPRVFSELEVEIVNDYSLLILWPGSDSTLQPVLFTAHYDVVPVEPGTEEDWQHPAYDGVVADGRIYGRGTLDDKVGVTGLLEAAEDLLQEGFSPRRSLVFAFGHDEEIGGREGARALAARMTELGLSFGWMVDEGGMVVSDHPLLDGRPVALVNIAEKGYVTLTLRTSGEGGHSSNPPAVSTIGRLANAVAKIEAKPLPLRMVLPVSAMLETLAPHVSQPERFVFNNLWLTESLVTSQMAKERITMPFVRTTSALTVFNAGAKENVVPQNAEALVNFRLLPGDTPEMIVAYVREIIDDPLVEVTYEQWDNMPKVSDHKAEGFGIIAEAIEAVYPEAVVVPSLLMATLDTRHYVDLVENQYRFHGIEMTMKQVTSIHGTDEYIGIESYKKSIEVARNMLALAAQ